MNWFGKDDDESRDGNSAYSNREGFIFHNYDINDVEESKLNSLPAYDFSGPDPTINGDASSTKDSSLLSSNTAESTEASEAKGTADLNGKKVYLAPLYCGLDGDQRLCRTIKAYDALKKKYGTGSKKFGVKAYRSAVKKVKNPSAENGYGMHKFKGKYYYDKTGALTQMQWKLAWDACYRIGTQLKADGCDVMYPYSVRKYTNKNDTPNSFLKTDATLDILSIASDIAKKKPDYVIWIGFNDGAFGLVSKKAVTTNTLFLYKDYSGASNNGFAKSLQSKWASEKDLAKELPASKNLPADKYDYEKASVIGINKVESAITQLYAVGYKGTSAAILFGSYNSNVTKAKAKYSYNSPKVLYTRIAQIIEQAL